MKTKIKLPQFKNIFSNRQKLSLPKVAKYIRIVAGSVILSLVLIFIFFHDPLINTFLKDRITKSFNETNPAYLIKLGDMNYNIWNNRLGCDSLMLKSSDSMFTCSVASFSVSGISWIKVLLRRDFTTEVLTSSVIDANKIIVNYHRQQSELRFETLHISIPDSDMTVDSIKYYSLIDDEQFFAKSQFRQTRFRFNIPQITITGLDFLSLLQGNIYKAESIKIYNVFADILVNMDKLYDKNFSKPRMPNEALASMKETIRVDSLKIINARLKYCERYEVKATPGVITFDNVNISVSGIVNHTDHPVSTFIRGEGIFMNSGTMKLFMEIPLASKDFSLRYSGSLSTMDVTKLNEFIEPAEHHRIKSGILETAEYNIDVNSGRANGTLRVTYENLSIAVLNKITGSENGIIDQLSTLIGKIFVIRKMNVPDKNGKMKLGEIKYTRDPEDYFFQFLWFSLRSGIGDVVGF